MQEGKEERGNIECLGEVIKQLLNTTCSLKPFNKNTRRNSLHLPIVKQEKLPLEYVFPNEVLAIILLSVYPKSHLTDNTP